MASELRIPSNFTINPLMVGQPVNLSWNAVDGATDYEVQRKVGGTFTGENDPNAELVYTGPNTNVTEYLPESVRDVSYRVKAYIHFKSTWEDIQQYTVGELDAMDWSWEIANSDWNTSGLLTMKRYPDLDVPKNFIIPDTFEGKTIKIQWDSVENATDYEIQWIADGAFPTSGTTGVKLGYTGPNTYCEVTVPDGVRTIAYRVKAYIHFPETWMEIEQYTVGQLDNMNWSWSAEDSPWNTSGLLPVKKLVPPHEFIVSDMVKGHEATISWNPVEYATNYEVQWIANDGFAGTGAQDIRIAYSGSNTYCAVTIPDEADTVSYRIKSYIHFSKTWTEIEQYTVGELDVMNWKWEILSSEWNEFGPFTVNKYPELEAPKNFTISSMTEKQPATLRWDPVKYATDYEVQWFINGSFPSTGASGVGVVYNGTNTSCTVTIPSGAKTIAYRVKAYIHFTKTWEEIEQYTVRELDALDWMWEVKSGPWTTTGPFYVTSIAALETAYFILRDGIPVARINGIFEWRDYTEVGDHTYQIIGVRNGIATYSNTVAMTIEIPAPQSTLALMESPEDYIVLDVKKDQNPQMSLTRNMGLHALAYVNGGLNQHFDSGQEDEDVPISYTITDWNTYYQIRDIVKKKKPVVYRSFMMFRCVGVIDTDTFDYIGTLNGTGSRNIMIEYSATIQGTDYREEVDYD